MERKLVSRADLVRLLNERVREIDSFSSCTVVSVIRLPESEGDGCNWDTDGFKGVYCDAFLQAVREISAGYNLRDDA